MLKTLAALSCLAIGVSAYSTSSHTRRRTAVVETTAATTSRRGLLGSAVAAATALTFGNAAAAADGDENLTDVYMGVGCFWHIQHEFVDAERKLLGRGDHRLTSRAGYAGGTKAGSESRVCYHNFRSVADYGKLGREEMSSVRGESNGFCLLKSCLTANR